MSDELDAALRRALYVEGACIRIHAVLLEVAAGCGNVADERLADLLKRRAGRAAVFAQWRVAEGDAVQGSPHLYTADDARGNHNPGVDYRWTATGVEVRPGAQI